MATPNLSANIKPRDEDIFGLPVNDYGKSLTSNTDTNGHNLPDGWSQGLMAVDYVNRLEQEAAQVQRDFEQSSAREAMAFEADQAKINRDFQAEMSNSAYQRAIADLKKAGLNPALAYQQGGASTSSGATASGSSASGSKATGTKAGTNGNVLASIVSQYINQSTQVVKSVLSLADFF